MAIQEVQSTTPTLSNVRPQDLIVDFLRTQTALSVRLSENLQDLSRDLLERVRKIMANKISLDGSFNNGSMQTVFQLAATIGSGCLQMRSIGLGSLSANLAATLAPIDTSRAGYAALAKLKTKYDTQKGYADMSSSLVQGISQTAIAFLQGNAETYKFSSEELDKFHKENAACLTSTRSAQDTLTTLVKQIASHS